MALFKMAAGDEMLFLFIGFGVGYAHRGSDIYFLFLAILAAAAMLLFVVRMLASRAEATSVSVILSPDDGADAIAVALAIARAATKKKGIGSIASWWKRVALRGMLLLTVGLSAAASFLAVAIFQEGHPLHAAARWPMVALLNLTFALVHGFFAWVAICKD